MPLNENWLYLTKPQRTSVRPEETFKVSEKSPEWFKSPNPNADFSKEGTITLFSRLSGWIYVSGESRNRKHRLGKREVSCESGKGSIQDVSNLAPGWMQRENASVERSVKFKNFKPPAVLRQERKRMILVDQDQPEKSIFSIGDFRHDIRTSEEVLLYNQGASNMPKSFYGWKEDMSKQGYDKPITEKIGARRN